MVEKGNHERHFEYRLERMDIARTFHITAEDDGKAFENALVDKLGENAIVWEKDGFSDSSKLWLTYEETIDANTSQRPLQTEEKSRDRVGGASA